MLNKIVRYVLHKKLKEQIKIQLRVPEMFHSISSLKSYDFTPKNIIDVGAYEGKWALEVIKIFPNANFLLVEAMPDKASILEKITQQHPNINHAIALLGAEKEKEIVFNQLETASSALEEFHETNASQINLTTKTLDDLLFNYQIEAPDFIKIDTQGYELEILKGGIKALQKAKVVLLEVSLLDIHKNVPLIHNVLDFMNKKGFVTFDICSFTRRPLDNALWQVDIIFVKENSVFRQDKRW